MGAKQSTKEEGKGGNLQKDLEAFVEQSDRLKQTRAEEERKRISCLVGVDPDDLTWIKDSQGTQSSHFVLVGDRWGGRAFVKGQKLWTQDDLVQAKQLLGRIQDLEQGGDGVGSPSDVDDTGGTIGTRPETTVLLKREREFLRSWYNAKAEGKLILPEDTTLMVPKLIEPVLLGEVKQDEEDAPTFLVFQNLAEKGYHPMDRLQPLTVEDEKVLVKALADLHFGMFQIKEDLQSASVEMVQGILTTVDAAGESITEIKDVQKRELERCIKGFGTDFREVMYDFFISRIDEVRNLMLATTEVNWYTHGDPIVENFMLKRNAEGNITGVAFVDFANVGLQSPLVDLFGFVHTSIEADEQKKSGAMKSIQEEYKARLVECFPECEIPRKLTGEFYFSADDTIKALCKTLRYFLDDLAWNKNDDLLFRQVQIFNRAMLILKQREENNREKDG